jgi:hypothetical protein
MPNGSKNATATAWICGIASTLALLANWTIVGYMSFQNDPGSTWLNRALGNHVLLEFAFLATCGLICGIVATTKLSKAWLIPTILNALSFLLELCVS